MWPRRALGPTSRVGGCPREKEKVTVGYAWLGTGVWARHFPQTKGALVPKA